MAQPLALSPDFEALIQSYGFNPRRSPFKLSDRLEEDLQMAPEDIEDLLAEYFERFSIDPGDFAFNRYYPFRGIRIPFLTKWQFKRWGIIDYRVAEPLTLGMLQHAIDTGRWDTAALRHIHDQST